MSKGEGPCALGSGRDRAGAGGAFGGKSLQSFLRGVTCPLESQPMPQVASIWERPVRRTGSGSERGRASNSEGHGNQRLGEFWTGISAFERRLQANRRTHSWGALLEHSCFSC